MATYIEINKARKFGEKLNVTFTYFFQNFRSIAYSMLIILLPLLLVNGLLFALMLGTGIASAQGDPFATGGFGALSGSYFAYMFISFIASFFTGALYICVIYFHMKIYKETGGGPVTVKAIWENTKSTFTSVLGQYIGLNILFMIGGIIAALAFIGIPAATQSTFFIFLGAVGFFCLIFYFLINLSLVFIIKVNEGLDFFDTIKRSTELIKGKWWSTFGLILIIGIITIMLVYATMLPLYLLAFIGMFNSADLYSDPMLSFQENFGVIGTVVYTLFTYFYYVVGALPMVAIGFQYYNLVELKEATGLIDEISTLGKEEDEEDPDEDY